MRRRMLLCVSSVAVACATVALVACGTDDPPSSPAAADAGASDGSSAAADSGQDVEAPEGDSGACTIPKVDDPDYGASGGPPGCSSPTDCTVRFTGDYCCPDVPQAMTGSAATTFDESLNGFGLECRERCKTVRCGPKPDAAATCVEGRCALL